MKFLEFLGIETRSGSVGSAGGTSPLPGILPPSRSSSGLSVERALALPPVYRSVTILSTAVSQLELKVWRNEEQIDTPSLVRSPDADRPLSSFLKRTVIGLATYGNAYWRVFRSSDSSAYALQVLDPRLISIRYDDRGNKLYDYAYGAGQVFRASEVKHLRLGEFPGEVYGKGPIQAASSTLLGALDLVAYADNWFQSGIPNSILSTTSQLTPEVADEMKSRFVANAANHEPVVLGQGTTWQAITLDPAKAQFLETRQFITTDIARLFGIPASYLLAEVNGNSMTYSNLEQADTAFVKYALSEYTREIEEAFSSVLVRGQTARFDFSNFLRPDAKTQADIDATYLGLNVISADEVRQARGWSGPAPKPKPVPIAPAPEVKDESSDTSTTPTNEEVSK